MITSFVSTPADMMWQLDDIGVDYTTITDWDLFYNFLYPQFMHEATGIIFGDFDFSNLKRDINNENEKILSTTLDEEDISIDYYTYLVITEFIRKIHGFVKNEKKPANETTKRILIEDAKEEFLISQKKEYHSYLLNLVSAMVNSEGFKFNYNNVWDMNIYAFLDSVKRISKIKESTLLLQSGYSGFGVDLKKINNKQLNWLGEL